jgi:hypothetical protein
MVQKKCTKHPPVSLIRQNVDSTKNTATLQILQKIRWSHLYFNRKTFTTRIILHPMAYEIVNARRVDLWDKKHEVNFSQLCVLSHFE